MKAARAVTTIPFHFDLFSFYIPSEPRVAGSSVYNSISKGVGEK